MAFKVVIDFHQQGPGRIPSGHHVHKVPRIPADRGISAAERALIGSGVEIVIMVIWTDGPLLIVKKFLQFLSSRVEP